MPKARYQSVRSLPLEERTERALCAVYGDEFTSGELQVGELREDLDTWEGQQRFLALWNYGERSLKRLIKLLDYALDQ